MASRPSFRRNLRSSTNGKALEEKDNGSSAESANDVPKHSGTYKYSTHKDPQARLFGSVVVGGRQIGSKSQTPGIQSRKQQTPPLNRENSDTLGNHFTGANFRASDSSQKSDESLKKGDDDDTVFALDAEACKEYLEGLKSDLALQLEINRLEILASLVPARIIKYHMENSKSQRVFSERFQAAVLFADISGFSSLAERLVKEIKHVAYAAENLSRYIGASLEKMVATIANRGGDVIKFAGDAILAVFPAKDFNNSLEEATLCCTQVGLELAASDFSVAGRSKKPVESDRHKRGEDKSKSTLRRESNSVRLSVHCGVGCGTLVSYHVGGLNERWEYVVTGSPVEQIGTAETEAKAGETVISKQTYDLIGERLKGERLPSGNFLLSGFNGPKPKFPTRDLVFTRMKEFTSKDPLQYKRLQEILRCYVPPPALVSIDSGNGIWSGELRECSTVFCRLLGLRYEGKESDINMIQDSFKIVHENIRAFEGTLLRFIVDDKGAGVLSAFGLPPQKHENDSVRAVKASLSIVESLENLRKDRQKWKVGCSIGITTGEVFCGTVGGHLRCEYTLHGVKVNLAARLMVAAKKKNHILCDKQTHDESKSSIKFGDPKKLTVKGIQGPIEVYRPKQQRMFFSLSQQTGKQVGRSKEEECVKRLLNHVIDPLQPIAETLVVRGDAGLGKTRLCQYAVSKAKRSPFLTLIARGDDTEMHTPFFLWKGIISQLLQYFVGIRKLGTLSDDELMKLLEEVIPHQNLIGVVRSPRDSTDSFGSSGPHQTERDDGAFRRKDSSDSGEIDEDGLNLEVRKDLRTLFPLLRKILPNFFKLGGKPSDANQDAGDSEVSLVNLLRLIVEIIAKASKDLEHADKYFDTTAHGIAKNQNVVRLFIIIEDVQWADPYSIEALYRLMERELPVALLITCRENLILKPSNNFMPNVEPSPAGESLREWYQKIANHPSAQQALLEPLKMGEIHECLRLWIQADSIPARLVGVVFDKSQGHPFFAKELCKLMEEDKVYTVENGVCILSKDAQGDDFGLPSTVSALMTSRIDRIPASQQLTLKVAAVIGNEFQMHGLAAVLLSYSGIEENEEAILEEDRKDESQNSSQRKKGLVKSSRSSINPLATARVLQDDDDFNTGSLPLQSRTASKGSAAQSAAAAGDLREIAKLLKDNIEHLTDDGFLVSESDANGEKVIRFSSVMLRESAYALLLFKMRKSLHLKVAEFYESKHEDYLQPVYLRLANHYFCAESHERAMYYLEIAGDDALELHSMQAVWLCFTRLLAVSKEANVPVDPWKRASWFRKAAESYLFFGQIQAAEECLRAALEEIRLDVNTIGAQQGISSNHSQKERSRRRSWISKLFKLDGGAGLTDGGPRGESSMETRNPLVQLTAREYEPGSEKVALANQKKLLDHQESTFESGHDVTIARTNDRNANRNAFAAKHHQGTGGRPRGLGGAASSFIARAKGTKFLEALEAELGAAPQDHGPFHFVKKLFRERSRKKGLRNRQAEVQRNLNAYRKVENLPAFKEAMGCCENCVEILLEGSRVYGLLASLIFDQTSPLGLERRLNAMTLAKTAFNCAMGKQKRPGLESGTSNGSSIILDLNDHKVEVRQLDPKSASLDQLAYCYASACLFFMGMSRDWAKDIAKDYKSKTLELLPEVSASGTKGKIAILLGEYFMLSGEFTDADELLHKSTWIFNFLQFHRDKLESLETHVILELLSGRSRKYPIMSLSMGLFQDGVGIYHVNCLCAFVEVCSSRYECALKYLEQVLEFSLGFLRGGEGSSIDHVFEISLVAAEQEEPDGLIVLALLVLRRFGYKDMAMQLVKVGAAITKKKSFEHLPIRQFHLLFAVFQIVMESYSDFVDSLGSFHASEEVKQVAKSLAERPESTSHLSTRRSSVGAESSEPGIPAVDSDRMRKNERNPHFRFPLNQERRTSEAKFKQHTKRRKGKGYMTAPDSWRKFQPAAVTRRQCLGMLQELLEIVELFADSYPPCKAYASYCAAVVLRVKCGRGNSKVMALLEKCAEQAHDCGIKQLKAVALLELGILRAEVSILEQLKRKFVALHDHFSERRCRAEILTLEEAQFTTRSTLSD